MRREQAAARLRQLVTALQASHPERVSVCGSWARGEEDELSDLDLVVLTRTPQPFCERLRDVSQLLPAGTGGVDILV